MKYNNIQMNNTENKIDNSNQTIFWYDNYFVLFDNLQSFFPTHNMNVIEKLNSLMRLSIYTGFLLALITNNYQYLYIPIFVGIFTIYIYNNEQKSVENYLGCDKGYNSYSDEPCIKPTNDNPFMNFNQISDDRNRAPACNSFDNPKIQNEMDDKFYHNLYRDVSDLYDKNNSQREFYTMPSTTSYNDQTAFAKWLYNTGPTCKEDTTKCISEWNPIDTNQVFENLLNH